MREPTLEEFIARIDDFLEDDEPEVEDPRFGSFDLDDDELRLLRHWWNAACDPWRRLVAS